MSWPIYASDEIDAVQDVLRRGQGNAWSGPDVAAFEADYAAYVGVPHAVALSNGTVALELGLRALGIGPGDEVLVTARSFMASASAIVAVGARPVFADVDADSQNVTAATLEAVRTARTRAVVLVHLAGWMCEMDGILAWAGNHGLKVLEDCAQAHGATYQGRAAGSFGHAAAWSFCQDKIISTGGEGGMLTTADPEVWRAAWMLKDHGKSPERMALAEPGPHFRWVHEQFGTNARMTAMQAAIGRLQLGKCTAWVAGRAALRCCCAPSCLAGAAAAGAYQPCLLPCLCFRAARTPAPGLDARPAAAGLAAARGALFPGELSRDLP